jgi:hypothetical protein
MAILTTDLLIARLARRFRDTNFQVVTEDDWQEYLNDTFRWLQSHGGGTPWPWSEKTDTVTVTGGTATVALPAGTSVLKRVYNDTDKQRLRALQGNTAVDDRWPDEASQGVPLEYRVYGNVLHVYPTPSVDTDILLEYIGQITQLDADLGNEPTDTGDVDLADIGIPDQLAYLIAEYALYLAFLDDENEGAATLHLANAEKQLTQAMITFLSGQTSEYPQIVDRFFSS